MMASAWIVVVLVASVQGVVHGIFSSNHDPPRLESVLEKWPGAQSVCLSKCNCTNANNKLAIDCRSRNFDAFPDNLPPLVAELNFVGNNIFKLSYNVGFSALSSLNVSANHISEIDSKWIGSLVSLKYLDVSKNTLRSRDVENVFRGVGLLHLDLSFNHLDVVSDAMFQWMGSLRYLNLSFCEIERISYDSFSYLHELATLDLSHNRIIDIQHEWLRNLKSLQRLYLGHNNIKFLRNVVFATLKDLRVLDLSENYIKSVGLLSFKGLTKLQFLNVSRNDISHLQEGVFRSLELAEVIDLSENSISSLDNIFTHAKNLERLHLRDSHKLRSLTPSSLYGARNLRYLDLSGSSSLSEIHKKSFSHAENLNVLDVSSANLTNLRMGVFNGLRQIETLKINDNPWRCDCYMYWLLRWLGEHTNSHLLAPSETQCSSPERLEGHVLLDALDHSMVCTNATIQNHTNRTKFKVGSSAFLECSVDGSPNPRLTWITPQKETFYWDGVKNVSLNSTSDRATPDLVAMGKQRFYLTPGGALAIDSVRREDGGFYYCVASNPLGHDSVSIRLTLDFGYLQHIKIVSVLVGLATSFGFLLVTLVSVLIQMILRHFGIKCMCRSGNASPRSQQIKKILESMEHYKRQQLDRLRGNYNMQVQKIKDNCMQQMERLRESYSSQAETLRDFREYGTLQIDRIRENYYSQVQRVRDYSNSQIVRLRENYLYQRNRIRKFSAHHLYKLRENYKVQQQHLNKILENLNIESCRNVCQRTESVVFEPDINILVPQICLQTLVKGPIDPNILLRTLVMDAANNDSSSQISAYFTPDEAGSEISGHESDASDGFEGRRKIVKVVTLRIEDKATSTSDISDNKCESGASGVRSFISDNKCESGPSGVDSGIRSFSNETIV